MIEIKDFVVLLQKEKIFLHTNVILNIYKSLNSKDHCYFTNHLKNNLALKKIYNSKWLFENIKITKDLIYKWETNHKIHVYPIFDAHYPRSFLKLKNPPSCIYVLGDFEDTVLPISIVGRREAKPYTLNWMEQNLVPVLKSYKPNVISGGARGVDTKAHELAIMNDCKTTYLMPSGLLNLYPHCLQTNTEQLLESGACFISTYLPDSEMRKQNFTDRNLLIAALSSKVLILEAEIRSGTYKTANYATELGCDLGVVPSFPTDPSYSGSLQLIYDGAQMIRDAKDLELFLMT